jgi:hypothetical protein
MVGRGSVLAGLTAALAPHGSSLLPGAAINRTGAEAARRERNYRLEAYATLSQTRGRWGP